MNHKVLWEIRYNNGHGGYTFLNEVSDRIKPGCAFRVWKKVYRFLDGSRQTFSSRE